MALTDESDNCGGCHSQPTSVERARHRILGLRLPLNRGSRAGNLPSFIAGRAGAGALS
jgi:hypothetical protein